jgi:hypothetical protein
MLRAAAVTLGVTLALLGGVLQPSLPAAHAQTGPLINIKNALEPIGEKYNQPNLLRNRSDLQGVLVGRIAAVVRIFLTLLGILFVVLIIYGGYLWMTAFGNEERVRQGQSVLRQSLIGLLVILAAFAATQFIILNVYRATT